MPDPPSQSQQPNPPTEASCFVERVGAGASRKLRARRHPANVWFGLGMTGLVGWSVAVPTLLGAALGLWLDGHHPGAHSWTLALLVGGMTLGCGNAWYWVAQELADMEHDKGNDDD